MGRSTVRHRTARFLALGVIGLAACAVAPGDPGPADVRFTVDLTGCARPI